MRFTRATPPSGVRLAAHVGASPLITRERREIVRSGEADEPMSHSRLATSDDTDVTSASETTREPTLRVSFHAAIKGNVNAGTRPTEERAAVTCRLPASYLQI